MKRIPRKTGRRKFADIKEVRDCTLSTVVSASEKKWIDNQAAVAGLTRSAWITLRILERGGA